MKPALWLRLALSLNVSAAGCTIPLPQPDALPAVPMALQAPAGAPLSHVLHARGAQIYTCAALPGRPGEFAWVLQAPEALLTDAAGRSAGKHYAGPTWQANDGSVVVGHVRARHDAPDAGAIPWLLLGAASVGPEGSFSGVSSIQRLQTVGGKAPTQACQPDSAAVRVPYRAVYYFYKLAA